MWGWLRSLVGETVAAGLLVRVEQPPHELPLVRLVTTSFCVLKPFIYFVSFFFFVHFETQSIQFTFL